jgi:hypothetical protein
MGALLPNSVKRVSPDFLMQAIRREAYTVRVLLPRTTQHPEAQWRYHWLITPNRDGHVLLSNIFTLLSAFPRAQGKTQCR